MKKVLPLTLAIMIMSVLPNTVFADGDDQTPATTQPTTQEVTTGSTTIALSATKASSYSVKLPTTLDVSGLSTDFKIYAKGDILNTQTLTVAVGSGTHALVDDTKGSTKTSALTVTVANGSFTYSDLSASAYNDNKCATFTIAHDALLSGNYSYNLPISISLN